MQLIVNSVQELEKAVEKIIEFADEQKVWTFLGEMGAGKTTLIKAIAQQFNVEDNVHSPTFSIVNEYGNYRDDVFYHFDFYRIKNEVEVMDIGIDEYFDSDNICFIEWPQKIPSLLPEKHFQIELKITSDTGREIKLQHHGR